MNAMQLLEIACKCKSGEITTGKAAAVIFHYINTGEIDWDATDLPDEDDIENIAQGLYALTIQRVE